MKGVVLFGILIAVIGFNLSLMVQHTGLLVQRRVSKDGWTEVCRYYKPFWIVTITRPIQTPCMASMTM